MITYKAISKTGERKNNEDCIRVSRGENRFCAALADGLGGHGYGDQASALVTECTIRLFEEGDVSEETMRRCFEESQRRLLEVQAQEKKESAMKTTLTILMADGEKLLWGHVGDSRIYHFAQSRLVERTLDHSVPQMLVAAGEITEQQIRRHPDRNRLLRVMGVEWQKPPYTLSGVRPCEPGHAFLLCSDGFWEWIDENEMTACLRRARSATGWLSLMQRIVLKKGRGQNMDNYSAVCVWT